MPTSRELREQRMKRARAGTPSSRDLREQRMRRARGDTGGGGGYSPLGFVGNLGGDIAQAVAGLPAGLVQTVRHPIRTGEQIAQSYAHQYGPFLHGDFDEGFKRFYNDPLGPILDALTVASLGLGAAAALPGRTGAAIATSGRTIKLASPAQIAKQGGRTGGRNLRTVEHFNPPILEKPVSRRPLRGWQQIATDRVFKMLPADTPLAGEIARYARALDKAPRHEALKLRVALRPFQKSYSKLKEPERIAFNLLGRGISPEDYKNLLLREQEAARAGNLPLFEGGERVHPGTLKLLDREDVRAAYADPSPRLQQTLELGREAAGIAAGILIKKGWLTPDDAAVRPYLAARLVSGAEFKPALRRDLFADAVEQGLVTRSRARTRDEAVARIDELDALVDPQIERVYKYLRSAEPTRAAPRFRGSAKEYKGAEEFNLGRHGSSAAEYTAAGERRVGRAYRERTLDEAKRLDWQRAEEMLFKKGTEQGAHPFFVELAEQMAERDELSRLLTQNAGAAIMGEAPEGFGLVDELSGDPALKGGYKPTVVTSRGVEQMELRGGKSIDEIRRSLEAGGKPEPFYLPDAMVEPKVSLFKGGGGRGPTARLVYQNQGLLLRTGKLALEPDLLSGAYLRTVKGALYDDLHAALVNSGIRVPVGEPLPKGWVFLRRNRRERIRYTERNAGDFERSMDDLLPDPDTPGESQITKEDFATRDAHAGDLVEGGIGENTYRVAVPDAFVTRVTGEFTRSNKAIEWFLRKPTKVWRALVLNLRPAWLVNNIVGNHLLYAIRFAGPNGLRAYVNAVRSAGRESVEFKRLVNDVFPEQVEGTFIGTQRPDELVRAQNVLSAGLAPIDRRVEGALRRAATEAAARKHPAVRAKLRELPAQKHRFERALRELEKDNPHAIREISSEVDAALGSFLNMSPFEQRVVRAAIPFYGWYRAITMVVLKMPIETPGRALLLSKLGQVGAERTEELLGQLPSFLRGAIPISRNGDEAKVVTTSGLNPLDTVRMVGRSTAAALAGDPGALGQEFGGSVNPLISTPLEAATGRTLEGQRVKEAPLGLLGIAARNLGESLPQVRLGQAAIGNLYQGTQSNPTLYSRDFRSELLSYMGIPVKRANLRRARSLAEEGR